MMDPNPWFWLALVATIGLYKLELLASLLNLSRLGLTPPPLFADQLAQPEWEKLREYVCAHSRADMVQHSVQLLLLLGFWWGGGFNWLATVTELWSPTPLLHDIAILGVAWLALHLLSLPFDIWNTFGIEARFGFNTTSLATFAADRLKGMALTLLLGLPLLFAILWLFHHVGAAALYAWLAVTAFSLLLGFLAPRFLLPLFYKFTPLQDPSLETSVLDLAGRLGFPVREVRVVDGSRRSTKGNAFFSGFGRTRRIALFDTLLKTHPHQEILAILAHEIGHWRRGHIPKQLIFSTLCTGVFFALLHFCLSDPSLGAAFGISQPPLAINLLLFLIVSQPLSLLTQILGSLLSRKFEYEADAYAQASMPGSNALASALRRLNHEHLSHPTPHPLHILLHHSHPPVLQRLAALSAPASATD